MNTNHERGPEPLTLFDVARPEAGRHERALTEAIAAAEEAGRLEAVDGGLVSLALANAFALDRAETLKNAPYAVAALTGPYREVLEALRLTPNDRMEEANDELSRALAALDATTVRDAGTVGD